MPLEMETFITLFSNVNLAMIQLSCRKMPASVNLSMLGRANNENNLKWDLSWNAAAGKQCFTFYKRPVIN